MAAQRTCLLLTWRHRQLEDLTLGARLKGVNDNLYLEKVGGVRLQAGKVVFDVSGVKEALGSGELLGAPRFLGLHRVRGVVELGVSNQTNKDV